MRKDAVVVASAGNEGPGTLGSPADCVGVISVGAYDSSFGIYDTFPDEDGRQDHIHGEIVKSLRSLQQELLAEPPRIRQVDLLAVKHAPARSEAAVAVA